MLHVFLVFSPSMQSYYSSTTQCRTDELTETVSIFVLFL